MRHPKTRIKKKVPHDLNTLFKEYASTVELRKADSPTMIGAARGNKKSRTICIFHPMPEDIEESNLFASEANNLACQIMQEAGIPVGEFFCIPSYLAEKPRNGNTEQIRQFLEQVANQNLADDFILVGTDAFRFTIGKGSKPDAKSLIGNPVFPTLVNHKRTITLPDTHTMVADPRAEYYVVRSAKEATAKFEQVCRMVAQLL